MYFPFSHHGVLGLNARNLLYIKPFNPKKAVALADDKLRTKAFLSARGVPVAKVYGRIEDRKQLRSFDFANLPDQCVLKPTHGFGGEGITILKGRKNGEFLEQGKRPISDKELREHIEDILDGRYSLNGMPDSAFFERLLVPSSAFAQFLPAGLPDIRIVVFNLVPVMAMLRIPTAESAGKANVHLGGIGIGIDIAKGVTTHAVQYDRLLPALPHGGSPAGLQIPQWEELLLISSRIQYNTNIGYLAVDLTIDEEQGPVLLEVNARAGLMVQVANLAPLRSRLERVGGVRVHTPEKGVRLAQDLFGVPLKKIAAGQDRPVLGMRETILVSGSRSSITVPVLITPDHERTIFASDLLRELLDSGSADSENSDERTYRVKFSLGGRKIQTVVREGDVMPSSVRGLIGRRDLSGFLLDPSKTAESPLVRMAVKDDLRAIDKILSQIDRQLPVLKLVKPVNLREERAKAVHDLRYNPQFQYQAAEGNFSEMEAQLAGLAVDDSPIGILFKKKARELYQRIMLIRSLGNARRFSEASALLFGTPTSELITSARAILQSREACELPSPPSAMLTAEQALPLFEESLASYGLHDWQVVIRERSVSRVTVGGKKIVLRSAAVFPRSLIRAIIAHEIETHVLTAENGDHQPFDLFRRGFANYMDTQEGLAIYNQNRFLSSYSNKRYRAVRNILAVAFAAEHSFADTRRYPMDELEFEEDFALSKAIELKRGLSDTAEPGGFTKAIVYERGRRAIEQFVAQGGDLKRLYIGKIALEDLELLEHIPNLRQPIILPVFLRDEEGCKKKRS